MKRVKVIQLGVHQILLLAGLVIMSVNAQAVTLSAGREISDRAPNAGTIHLRSPNAELGRNGGWINIVNHGAIVPNPGLIIQPAPDSMNLPSASSSVYGHLNYSGATSSGNFSENDSSPMGSIVEVEMQRKGFGYAAEASAKTGLAQARVETKGNAGSSNGGNIGNSSANANSNWSDWFVISGGTGVGTASFTSLLDGVLASSKNGSASLSVNIGYTPKTSCFTLCGEADMNQTLLNQISSLSGKSKSTLEQALEGEFTFAYNKPFALTVMLGVYATNGGMADFTLGSLGNSLVLPEGANLYSASGLDYVQAVPEAETYAMMLAGLGLVGWAARRRRATPK